MPDNNAKWLYALDAHTRAVECLKSIAAANKQGQAKLWYVHALATKVKAEAERAFPELVKRS